MSSEEKTLRFEPRAWPVVHNGCAVAATEQVEVFYLCEKAVKSWMDVKREFFSRTAVATSGRSWQVKE